MHTAHHLSDAELADLRAIAGAMIPASDAHGVPGADDDRIFGDIAADAGAQAKALRRFIVTIGGGTGTLGELAPNVVAARVLAADDSDARNYYVLVLKHYYSDDRVMAALGLEPRAPFPRGYPLEEADPSLLDPVKARMPFWRPV